MEEEMLKRLVHSRNVLKRKFQSIKMGEQDKADELKNTFKPITEPIEKLLKLSNEKGSTNNTHKKEYMNPYKESIMTSTPNKKYKPDMQLESNISKDVKHEKDFQPDYSYESNDDTFFSENNDEDTINLSILNNNKKLDTIYGPHKANGEWKFGNKSLKISDQKITIGNQSWAFTPGLFELLFYKKPSNYDSSELDIYKKILLDSNAHKINYNADERIKSNKGYKYKHIIRKLMNVTHTGKGLMRVNQVKSNYIYRDDPNELIERLRLLIASQQAGNNNHTNEIVSIIEELREGKIIY